MTQNPCGFPYCKSTECDTCKHNKISYTDDNTISATEVTEVTEGKQ